MNKDKIKNINKIKLICNMSMSKENNSIKHVIKHN